MTRADRGRSRAAALLSAVLLAVATPGCGGQAQGVRDALEYTAEVNRVQGDFERDLAELRAAAGRAEVPADVERAVGRLARSIVGVQTDLRGIEPPRTVAAEHRALITAFGRWTAPLDRFRRALGRRRSAASLASARTAFVRDTGRAERELGTVATRINDRLRALSD